MKAHYPAFALLATVLVLPGCQKLDFSLGPSCDHCELRSQLFFERLSQGETRQAFAELGKARSRDRARWERTATETSKLLREDGPILGYEILDKRQIGSRLLEYKYLLYQDSNLTRWSLYYYHSKTRGWLLVNISGMPEHSQF